MRAIIGLIFRQSGYIEKASAAASTQASSEIEVRKTLSNNSSAHLLHLGNCNPLGRLGLLASLPASLPFVCLANFF